LYILTGQKMTDLRQACAVPETLQLLRFPLVMMIGQHHGIDAHFVRALHKVHRRYMTAGRMFRRMAMHLNNHNNQALQ
jgi:hypothetical protein